MQDLSVGIVGTSRKPDEHRLPIHPGHIGRIDVELRHRMFFERGYAHNFGVSDEQLAAEVAGLRSREQCSVIHALQLIGTTGAYGRRLQAVVVSFGATARGAVTALLALGVHDITVLTRRSVPAVAAPSPPARLVHYERGPEHPHRGVALSSYGSRSVAEFLAGYDIVVNCIRQDFMLATSPGNNPKRGAGRV